MHKYLLVESPNGYDVYVNLISSLAGTYLSRHPYVIGLMKEVLAPMKLRGATVSIEHDMGRIVGNTDIVETTDKDTIYYAMPYKKTVFFRYAKNRHPSPSKCLTIILHKDKDGNYEVSNTWVGPFVPPFPGDENATPKSMAYWETHAMAPDVHDIQSKTITRDCPY